MPRSAWIPAAGREGASRPLPGRGAVDRAGSPERELSLEEAEDRVGADTRALGWRARYRVLDDRDPTAVQCGLWRADGTEVPFGLGAGKGAGSAARVGARFEALEHAFTGPTVLDSLPLRLVEAADLRGGPFATDRAVRDVAGQDGARVACVRYAALDGGPDADVPVYLWAPWYPVSDAATTALRHGLGDTADYRAALSHSVNSGCAIGATRDEALLHALNEWVERDAFSLFLLRSVYDRGPMPATVPDAALPGRLRDQLDRARALVGGPVVLLDLTTDLGVPVVMAYAPASGGPAAAHRYGLGASLWGELAAERAVTEFVQGELLARVVAEQSASGDVSAPFARLVADHDTGPAVRARLSGHPRLLACAMLDFADRLDAAPAGALASDAVPPGTGVAAQREAVVARIAGAGHRVVAHTLAELAHGTTVVQVQCPGLERFHLVTQGHLALPGARGRRRRGRGGTR
ncbi:YcaO-like family protein [Nocardiopsis sp. NPDC049922]|uniref:YcaO-like family protein n=1 Tax=Nocardiopsis sp. NPDC049922 TaxID=3155157 RepID=UPI0033CFD9DA